jgi:uncharacterized oxidoreductase
MTSALIAHLKAKDNAVIVYISSVLGFVPMAATAVYSTTKAAIHSCALPQHFLLKDSKVRVLEIAPARVRSDLMNNRDAKGAMPLNRFMAETMSALQSNADELLVEGTKAFRNIADPNEHTLIDAFNTRAMTRFGSA